MDLCHPLLVGVLSDKEDEDGGGGGRRRRGRREVFLRVRRGLVQEVDVQHGRELCRLELDSLMQVDNTEAAWTREVGGPFFFFFFCFGGSRCKSCCSSASFMLLHLYCNSNSAVPGSSFFIETYVWKC